MIARTGGLADWPIVALAGGVVLIGSIVAAARPTISSPERTIFRRVNGLPEWWYRLLWLPMQLGNLVVGTVVGVVVSLLYGDVAAAVCVIGAMALKLVTERLIRHRMHRWLTVRRRPGASMPGAILRGDVPADGPSFPSGHVLLVAAAACVVATVLPPALVAVPFVLTGCVVVGRVYVGAHNPLDVTAGLGGGLVVGGILATVLSG